MTASEKALKDGIRRGEFIVAHGKIDVVLEDGPARGVMTVLVFAWRGSGFPPEHHSLS